MTARLEVTDRAVLQYLGEVLDWDIAALRQMLARRVAAARAHPGAVTVVELGVRYRVEAGALTEIALIERGARS